MRDQLSTVRAVLLSTFVLSACGRIGFSSHADSDAGPTLSDAARDDAASDGSLPDDVDAGPSDAGDAATDAGSGDSPAFVIEASEPLHTLEFGTEATFTVRLATTPAENVFVLLASSDSGEIAVSPSALAFTPENALAPQTVTVTGVDDAELDGDQDVSVITTNATTAGDYAGVDIVDISVINGDDESPGVVVVAPVSLVTNESGRAESFSVRLRSQPTDDVRIPIASGNEAEVVSDISELVFTS